MAQVEKCVCTIDSLSKKVQFELFCKRGVRKRYSICFDDEGDSLEARYNTAMPARLVIQPKTLLDCLSNFHTTALDELTLELPRLPVGAAGGGTGPSVPVLIRSAPSLQPATDPASATLHTELTMDSASFDEYVVPAAEHDNSPVRVTFSMKDFRTVVGLCDSIAQPMAIQLSSAGQPMVLGTRFLNIFEATFVMATMFEPNQDAAQSQPAATAAAAAATQSQQKREEAAAESTAPAADDTAMTDAPPAKRAQTQSPSKKPRRSRKERPKDSADDSDIVLPPAAAPAPAPEPSVKMAPSQRSVSGSSSSGPAAVVYAPRNSESEEQEQLRDVGTVYCDGSGDFGADSAAPAPSTAPEPGHTPDTASCSGSCSASLLVRRDDSAPPMLPAGRLFLGDSEIHLLPMFPARTQSNGVGAPRSTAEDAGAAAAATTATAIVKHEDDAMLDEDGTVQSTCPM